MEREKDRMREGMRVVLKVVRYSGVGWRGVVRDMQNREECAKGKE